MRKRDFSSLFLLGLPVDIEHFSSYSLLTNLVAEVRSLFINGSKMELRVDGRLQ